MLCLQYDYGQMLGKSQAFYRSQWVGDLSNPPNGVNFELPPPSWRKDAFTTEVGPAQLNWGDITGGVMEGGDAGGSSVHVCQACGEFCSFCSLPVEYAVCVLVVQCVHYVVVVQL